MNYSSQNTETTGPRSLEAVVESSIGRPPSETVSAPVPQTSSAVVARLLAQPPEVTDANLLASLKASARLSAEPVVTMRYPEGGGYVRVVERIELRGDDPDMPKARHMVAMAMTPAPEPILAKELARLRMLTKVKDRGDESALEAGLWMEMLGEYPADVAVDALKAWPKTRQGMWWPSWAELMPILERKAQMRRMLADKLNRWSSL